MANAIDVGYYNFFRIFSKIIKYCSNAYFDNEDQSSLNIYFLSTIYCLTKKINIPQINMQIL